MVGKVKETLDPVQGHFGLQEAINHPREVVEGKNEHAHQCQCREHLMGQKGDGASPEAQELSEGLLSGWPCRHGGGGKNGAGAELRGWQENPWVRDGKGSHLRTLEIPDVPPEIQVGPQ